jgi:hypothetical protein
MVIKLRRMKKMRLGRDNIFTQNYSLPVQTKETTLEIHHRWEIIIKLILNGRQALSCCGLDLTDSR